eukprot:scaffold161396_cov30-Tisochrysis_lutea.AAC.6
MCERPSGSGGGVCDRARRSRGTRSGCRHRAARGTGALMWGGSCRPAAQIAGGAPQLFMEGRVDIDHVSAEAILAMKNLLRKCPERIERFIGGVSTPPCLPRWPVPCALLF